MHRVALVVVLASGCSKKASDPPAPADKPTAVAPAAPASAGLAITDDPIPDFTGRYDKAFAQIDSQTRHTRLAFVRGCPALTCDPGAWEPEQVAHVCPKAYLATFDIPTDEVSSPDGATFKLDLHLAGPAENASTGTLERIKLELSHLDHDGVSGRAHHHTTDSSVDGSFHAEVCPRT